MSAQLSAKTIALIERAQPVCEKTFAIRSPIDGTTVVRVSDCGTKEARLAADNAVSAFASWRKKTAYERAGLLRRWHSQMAQHEDEIARLMVLEMGKPITEAMGEVRYAATFIEWFTEEAKRVYGETVPSQFSQKRIMVQRQPAGVAYGITPWNFPVAMVTRKVAPALATGCTFILKPAEQTPLSALYLASLWEEWWATGNSSGSAHARSCTSLARIDR
jgi:succinate-semialdehyde dehydrogenase / glutarate-semialdehyde dehydrogenase